MIYDILVFSKSNCPNCDSAKQLLDSKHWVYEVVSVETPEGRDRLTQLAPDARQMPQIFINGQRVGGLAGLQAALKQMGGQA